MFKQRKKVLGTAVNSNETDDLKKDEWSHLGLFVVLTLLISELLSGLVNFCAWSFKHEAKHDA